MRPRGRNGIEDPGRREIARPEGDANTSSLRSTMNADDLAELGRLLAVIARLRADDGCPWDRAQTMASMAPHLLEEAYEAVDALRRGERDAAREELGDVLMNVLMIARISREGGGFGVGEVAGAIADKLVRRHPHVFGGERAQDPAEAYRNWERIKQTEGGKGPRSALAGVPAALPALLRAFRVGEKAARAGFDWPDACGPRSKIDEELGELDRAVQGSDPAAIAHELGDVLFSAANLARHLGVEPEMALRATIDRFQGRFQAVEAELGPDLTGRTLDELEAAWQRAKQPPESAGGGPTE
jgi:MazG family protein